VRCGAETAGIQEKWLALEVDFRTLGFGEIVTELPQLNQFLVT
jgi:hypothetical protein